ncbi:MAG: SdrD B-like domain-containing protein [Pirellulales bacterium]
MGILGTLRHLCFGSNRSAQAERINRNFKQRPRGTRRCQMEELEARRLFATDVAPHVLLGATYFEEATGDDTKPDILQVSFTGGAAGTTLNQITINGDKRKDGLSDGDVFFDTAAGGLGAFSYDGLKIVSADGFTVNSVTVVDGGSQIIFDLTGFDAGEKLVFSVDADEAQYVDGANVDANSLVEGEEFQRSWLEGKFTAVGYVDLTMTAQFWDNFDPNFAQAQQETGLTLNLPNDQYAPDHDYTDRTAGAVVHQAQIPLATISGWVYHDRSDDGIFNQGPEEGIGGVTLELLDANGNGTGITTTASTDPSKLGFYEFRNLVPGTYGVREVQPSGWLDGKDTAGDHGGSAAAEPASTIIDKITGASLNYGDHGLNYNFGELLPSSISGRVHADNGPDCDFDNPDNHWLAGVTIDLLDGQGKLVATTTTDANGAYHFTNLRKGTYIVREHQPTEYYDGGERLGTVGGAAHDELPLYSFFTSIVLPSGTDAIKYDFCEKVGVNLEGNVYHDRDDDGNFDRPGEPGISGVVLKLLDKDGNDTGKRATTDSSGHYKFTNLAAGTYTVIEVQPSGWLDGKDTPGNSGGTAETAVGADKLSGIKLVWGVDGIEYNFGELLPGSIAGRVHADPGDDCDFDNPDNHWLAGVPIDLLDAQGNVLATTHTDQEGNYKFDGLRPGTYGVREHQPPEYFDGGERVGSEGGASSDIGTQYSVFTGIYLGSDIDAVHYDFCEKPPSSIAGRVHADPGADCDFDDPNNHWLAGVTIDLLDKDGNVIATTKTDAGGAYKFTGLARGQYTVREHQPTEYFDGGERVGSVGGHSYDQGEAFSFITAITLPYGTDAVHYDFCEKPPSSIAGRVHADPDADCDFEDPHNHWLEGVTIDLLDQDGNVVATTKTDALGAYKFTGLRAGNYTVREHQPTAYYDGGERVGTVGGNSFDVLPTYSIITAIALPFGTDATKYDFCEKVGVMLSGYVYHDRSNDGIYDRPGEQSIAGVTLKLLDANGNDTGLRATTDATGFYKFTNLAAGKYSVMEVQPAGWLDGIDTPGSLGGVADTAIGADMLSQIMLTWGTNGTEYNFGELLPGSIAGRVHADPGEDCDFDNPTNHWLGGVQIDLLDGEGTVLATTYTDAQGKYLFDGLRPGNYTVREHQPTQYYDGGERAGSVGGSSSDVKGVFSIISGIGLGSGVHAIQYDFCEKPGAELSGYVFIDQPVILFVDTPPTLEQIAAIRNGTRTPNDLPLGGVTVELRNGETGAPILVGDALPGSYPGLPTDPIRVVTDANGYYHFGGLKAGIYAVVEIQPNGLTDNVDTPGTTGGHAANPIGIWTSHVSSPTPAQQAVIDRFRNTHGTDAIVSVPLQYGQHSQENNFSEVIVAPEPPKLPPPPPSPPYPPPPPPEQPPVFGFPGIPYTPPLIFLPGAPPVTPPDIFGGSSGVVGYTWHLSVMNAGWPRSVTPEEVRVLLTSSTIDITGWKNAPMDQANWKLAVLDGNQVKVVREDVFGTANSQPVTGDFNGDGVTDIAVFIDGQWFIDLNGNGKWDEGDMWARLGSQDDQPVTGDWDADGKTDIGIFGPAWTRDPWAIDREPGLPDADNFPTRPLGKMKNMPPTPEDATSGGRILKRTVKGTNRADLIDHVFHYGEPADVPVAGDWNGDGIRQIGIFRDGQWVLDTDGDGRFTDTDVQANFGQKGDLPVVGDFNGDGVDDLAVFRAGKWIVDTNGNHHIDAQDRVFELGGAGDKPVVGDWNDDGTTDPGVFHPGTKVDTVARRAS